MKKEIILIGGGDHCKSAIDVIEQENKFHVAGIVDFKEKIGQKIFGYTIIASDDDLPKLAKDYVNFFITVGHVKNVTTRRNLYNKLKELGLNIPSIISPLAYISKHSTIQEGCIIFPFSVIDVDAEIGKNCIINHSSIIGHGAIIEDHCHISANCVLGKCHIATGTFIGGNCWINNGVSIAQDSIIGSAGNVIRTIEETGVYVGNPAKRLVK
ncbi:MAG TPA: NeuD/PglB/VioB family sugar acetyltransferase [Bacteroidales bacterium]|nr:NeuD/PglB/VioB family sugar acetyltransferase [Bacteroidales bacterium]